MKRTMLAMLMTAGFTMLDAQSYSSPWENASVTTSTGQGYGSQRTATYSAAYRGNGNAYGHGNGNGYGHGKGKKTGQGNSGSELSAPINQGVPVLLLAGALLAGAAVYRRKEA